MLANPYLIAIGIPLLLISCGAFARKLVRGTKWKRSDVYMGVELTLAAMTSALVYIFDLTKLSPSAPGTVAVPTLRLAGAGSFLAICFFLMLWVMALHQDWDKSSANAKFQFLWLGLIANLIGAGLLTAFVLLVKGI